MVNGKEGYYTYETQTYREREREREKEKEQETKQGFIPGDYYWMTLRCLRS